MVDTTGQPYAFVNDNPLNATDPLGNLGFDPCANSRGRAACMNKAVKVMERGPSFATLAKIAIVVVGAVGGVACVMATVGVCGALAFGIGSVEFSGGAIAVGLATGAASGAADYALTPGRHTAKGYFVGAGMGAAKDAVFFGVPEELVFGGLGKGAHAAQLNFGGALANIPRYITSIFR